MKKRTGRQSSNIIDARSDKARAKEDAKTDLTQRVLDSERTRRNEPVAWNNDKSEAEEFLANVANPGKLGGQYPKAMINSPGTRRKLKEPAPQKLSKNEGYYDNIPDFKFFKHTIKGK